MLRIEAPDLDPVEGGLLSVAKVRHDINEYAHLDGVEFWNLVTGNPRPVPADGQEKQFDSLGRQRDSGVIVYRGVEWQIMDDEESVKRMFRGAFEAGLSAALETHFAESDEITGAEDLGSTSNPWFVQGVLEQWAGHNVPGRPVIYTDRAGTSLLRDVQHEGRKLFTKQFSPIANCAGLSDDTAGTSVDVYVGAPATVFLGEKAENVTNDLHSNRRHMLIEQGATIVVPGPMAKMTLTVKE